MRTRLALALLLPLAACAQTPAPAAPAAPMPAAPEASGDEAEVRATIAALFDAMRAGDSTAVRATFHPALRMHSALPDGDGARLAPGDPERFIQAVGAPREDVWDEQLGTVEVRVDGGLASAWMPYRFYVGETFSHCGVNAMQLANVDGTWRIVNLIDTRRRECE